MIPRVAVTAEPFWHKVPGGTARAILRIAEALLDDGRFEIAGVAARHSKSALAAVELPFPVHHYSVPRPALYESWHRLGLFPVEQVLGPVDLIWAAAMAVPPASSPLVVSVHDLDFLEHPERLSARGRRFFPKAWQAARERADLLVCPTELVAEDIVGRGIDRDRVRVTPLGVELVDVTAEQVAEVRARLALPEEFVLWVGTIEPRKNLRNLVAAMSRLPDIPLVVAGPDGWVIDDADLLVPLGSRAVRVGRVAETDLHALYAAASVFAFPSLAEGFGLPVLEAMAQGTPVVTSAGTATEEVAGGAAVLVDPHDPEAIAAGVRSILDDDDLASRLRLAGPRRAAERTWASTAAGYAAAFDDVLGR
ncbi:MAG: glycosyltransferase family 1 protein [Actinomycetota bacterium]|nr:glycosyltransferase family 1 protein [Actinomycetota bacterium]